MSEQSTGLPAGIETWGQWECPLCEAVHKDPEDIFETTCKNGHLVQLGIVQDNGVRHSFINEK